MLNIKEKIQETVFYGDYSQEEICLISSQASRKMIVLVNVY